MEGKCPICGNEFKSDKCPHTLIQVLDRREKERLQKELEPWVRKLIREEMLKGSRGF